MTIVCKRCTRCGLLRPLLEFPIKRRKPPRRDTLSSWCVPCERDANRARMAESRKADPVAHRERMLRWKEKSRVRYLELKRAQGLRRRERLGLPPPTPMISRDESERDRKHVAALRHVAEKRPPSRKDWSEKEVAAWKHKHDPAYVIHQRMRVQIRKALAGGKDGRRWESMVGYTRAQLAEHLARQLPRGYTMNDFSNGRLHIDHIVPKSLFDVTDPEQLKACWALSNLRPLPPKMNISKGKKRVFLL